MPSLKPSCAQLTKCAYQAQSVGQWASALSSWNLALSIKQDPVYFQQRGLCHWYVGSRHSSLKDFEQSYKLYLFQQLFAYKSLVAWVAVAQIVNPKSLKQILDEAMDVSTRITLLRSSDLVWRCLNLTLELIERDKILSQYYLPQPWEDWGRWGIDPLVITS
jgi:hypothetical protein